MKAVRLTDTEIELLTIVGRTRHRETSQQGSEFKQDQKLDGLQISIVGAITEYAVAKHIGAFFSLNADYSPPFPPDLVSKSGSTIDVKCTSKQGGNLNAILRSVQKPVDIYILTEYHAPVVYLMGWIESENFLIDANIKNVGNGDFYSMPQSKLKKFA